MSRCVCVFFCFAPCYLFCYDTMKRGRALVGEGEGGKGVGGWRFGAYSIIISAGRCVDAA